MFANNIIDLSEKNLVILCYFVKLMPFFVWYNVKKCLTIEKKIKFFKVVSGALVYKKCAY